MRKVLICFVIIIVSIVLLEIPTYARQYRQETDLNNFDENRYPGYKEKISNLKNAYPNWKFIFFYTGLDWNTVLYNETTAFHGRNLIYKKTGEWVCPICGNKPLESSTWYCASQKTVSYYLDPRNFLNEKDLFQFETLSYIEGMYTEESIEKILSGTFMYNTTIRNYYNNDNYADVKFSNVMLEAGKQAGISPYHIASRIKQEIILSGGKPSGSASGNVEGYNGIFNFYNIRATGINPVENGLKYAQEKGWITPEISIREGAKIIASNYITKGQNTLYLEKFDVDDTSNSLYYHQYQQNVQAPLTEGRRIYDNTYSVSNILNNSFSFVIPVYENMPVAISEMPSDNKIIENIIAIKRRCKWGWQSKSI